MLFFLRLQFVFTHYTEEEKTITTAIPFSLVFFLDVNVVVVVVAIEIVSVDSPLMGARFFDGLWRKTSAEYKWSSINLFYFIFFVRSFVRLHNFFEITTKLLQMIANNSLVRCFFLFFWICKCVCMSTIRLVFSVGICSFSYKRINCVCVREPWS